MAVSAVEMLNRSIAMMGLQQSAEAERQRQYYSAFTRGVGSMTLDEFLARLREQYATTRMSVERLEERIEWALRADQDAQLEGKVICFV